MGELSTEWLRAERAALARARGRKRLDVILDSRDPERLVRELPAEDLFLAIHDVGLADAAPLVRLATPEQFRTFVDLDAWKADELDTRQVLLWLRLARGDDDQAYRAKLSALDVEVLELLIRSIVRIHDLEEDGEPGDEVEGTVERTPEGRFMLVYPSAGAEYAAARRLIDDLYAEDPFRAARLLYAVRWELPSELTETGLRWRNARLADLGFPSLEEALSLYAKVDLHAPLPPPGAPPEEPPGFFLAALESSSLFDRAAGLLADEKRDELQLHLVGLVNAAMVADRVDPADVDGVREHARMVRDTLSLGLAHLAGDDAAAASAHLAATALKRIFQIGFTRTLELQWRAQRLVHTLPLRLPGADGFLPEPPDGEALAAVLRRRPRCFGGPEGQAEVWPFATLADLARTSAALDRVEALGKRLAELGLEPARAAAMVTRAWGDAGLTRVRFGELLLTAAARSAAGLPPAFGAEALPAASLATAARAAFGDDGKLAPAFRDDVLASAGPAIQGEAAAALDRLEAELGPQVIAEGADALDPRFAAPWIVIG
ncbi:MAG TPA: DUF6178 family protein [Vulgatibacter sp.]|nr:DUF6178 family protein [Vulgatibacter sp.]